MSDLIFFSSSVSYCFPPSVIYALNLRKFLSMFYLPYYVPSYLRTGNTSVTVFKCLQYIDIY